MTQRSYDRGSVARRAANSLKADAVGKTVEVPDLGRPNDARAYCIHIAYKHLSKERTAKMRIEEIEAILAMPPTTFKKWIRKTATVRVDGKDVEVTIKQHIRGEWIGYKERQQGTRPTVNGYDRGGNRRGAYGYDLKKVDDVVRTVDYKLWQEIDAIKSRPLPKSGKGTNPAVTSPEDAMKRRVLAVVSKALDADRKLKRQVEESIHQYEEIRRLMGSVETLAAYANQPGCYMTTLTLSEAIHMRWSNKAERRRAIHLYSKVMLDAAKRAERAAVVASRSTA